MTDQTKAAASWLIGVAAFVLQAGGLIYYTGATNAQLNTQMQMLTAQVSELNVQLKEMRTLQVEVAVLKAKEAAR